MIARDVMTAHPTTVGPDSTVADAWDAMRELDVRHLPVVHDGALVGMLSDRDLPCPDVARLFLTAGADALRRDLSTPVAAIMSSDVISVEPDTELADIVGLLIEHKIGAVPVVESDTRTLIGIVSYIDVLKAVEAGIETQ